jgi:hypothetical protein
MTASGTSAERGFNWPNAAKKTGASLWSRRWTRSHCPRCRYTVVVVPSLVIHSVGGCRERR